MQAAGVHGLGAHCVLSLHGAGERSSGMQRANIRGIASKYHAHRGTPNKVLVFDSRPLSVGSGEGKWNAQSQKLTGKGRENWGTGANWRQLRTVLTWNGRASRFGVPAGGLASLGAAILATPPWEQSGVSCQPWEASTTTELGWSWQCKTFSLLVPQLSCIQTPKATVEPVSVATAFPVPAKITSTPNDQQTQYQTANNLAAEHKGTRNDSKWNQEWHGNTGRLTTTH